MTGLDPPELDLLARCARLEAAPPAAGGIDWNQLLTLAARHGVRPLLFRNLPADCPPPVRGSLGEACRNIALRNLQLTAELLRLLRGFERAGIPAVPLKGPALAASLYGDLGLREFADLDLLFRTADVPAAQALLADHGYHPELPLNRRQFAAALRSDCEFLLWNESRKVMVEIHWRFAAGTVPFPVSPEAVWKRLETAPLAGVTVRALAAEDLLLYLCGHAAKHHWEGLKWQCDVAELLRRLAFDWDAVLARASAAGASRVLLVSLLVASQVLDAPVPGPVLERAQKLTAVAALAAAARRRLGVFEGPESFGHLTRTWRTLESTPARLRHLLRVLFIPTFADWDAVRLPERLYFLYWLVRPVRLVLKQARRLPILGSR